MSDQFIEAIECEAAYCLFRDWPKSFWTLDFDDHGPDPERTSFLGKYVVEREAARRGVSISRMRAEQRAARRRSPSKNPQGGTIL
jgi:hypothetical protein